VSKAPDTESSLRPTGKTTTTTPKKRAPKRKNAGGAGGLTERFKVDSGGVWWFNANPKVNQWKRLCDYLEVIAQSRTEKGNEWGALLRFKNRDGIERLWNMPYALSSSDGGTEVIRALADRGLKIETGRHVKQPLLEYLSGTDVENRVRLVDKMGWHGGAYMFPDRVVGAPPEPLHYYLDGEPACKLASKGTLEEWKKNVAAYASGNDLLLFAISAAFAAPLLDVIGAKTCGFHFIGASSLGKSTIFEVAASVCGGPDYVQLWRATDNALEGTAAGHSDCLLILDEISQCDARVIGETVYMLGNGQGKARATKNGSVSELKHRWQLVLLSNGEHSLFDLMAKAGKKAAAGLEMRMLSVSCSLHDDEATLKRLGLFQTDHNFNGGTALREHLAKEVKKNHGLAFPAFVERLVADRSDKLANRVRVIRRTFMANNLTQSAGGQAGRAADNFSLVAAAGELATEWGVTGWEPGEAMAAAEALFKRWILRRGGEGNQEEKDIIEEVRYQLEVFGESRFTRWDDGENAKIDDHSPRTQERWGFRRTEQTVSQLDGTSTEAIYFVLPEAFRQHLANGHDPQRVARLLADMGALKRDGKSLQARARLPGLGTSQKRCYVIRAGALYPDSPKEEEAA
jgi:uncharacterized protein (DUF927 family)